jgi:hypothetical protein
LLTVSLTAGTGLLQIVFASLILADFTTRHDPTIITKNTIGRIDLGSASSGIEKRFINQ